MIAVDKISKNLPNFGNEKDKIRSINILFSNRDEISQCDVHSFTQGWQLSVKFFKIIKIIKIKKMKSGQKTSYYIRKKVVYRYVLFFMIY